MRVVRPMTAQALGHMPDDNAHLAAPLVVMRVPECKLLAAMRRAEHVVDVEERQLARLWSCRADQAEPQTAAPPRSCSAHSSDERWSIATPAAPRFPDSGRPRPSSMDHAAAGRGRWHPRSRTRSPTHAPSPFRTWRAGRGPVRADPASLPQAAGTPRACAPPLATAGDRHPTTVEAQRDTNGTPSN